MRTALGGALALGAGALFGNQSPKGNTGERWTKSGNYYLKPVIKTGFFIDANWAII